MPQSKDWSLSNEATNHERKKPQRISCLAWKLDVFPHSLKLNSVSSPVERAVKRTAGQVNAPRGDQMMMAAVELHDLAALRQMFTHAPDPSAKPAAPKSWYQYRSPPTAPKAQ
ncbi:unnamed protein product, partial [Ectocarpus sp. 12 AP-2014]